MSRQTTIDVDVDSLAAASYRETPVRATRTVQRKLRPTEEQQDILDAFKNGENLVIEAGAGTGKTSTLRMLSAARLREEGVYVAYNRAIADDAAGSFPANTECATAHSLAFRAVGYKYKHRLGGNRVPAYQAARLLGVKNPMLLPTGSLLTPEQAARVVMATIERFCHSADPEPEARHVPKLPKLDSDKTMIVLRDLIPPLARRAWKDLSSVNGQLRFTHDTYLKLWQLSDPRLPSDFIFLDEAQDANPVIAAIVEAQDAQLVAVGDRCQAIYGWRGAVDAMDSFPAECWLPLTRSFRFGPAIAREANKWLDVLDAEIRLEGSPDVTSSVSKLESPHAILCRTNAETVGQAMTALEEGRRVAITGGGSEIKDMAEAAMRLQAGKSTWHPKLFAFNNWREVKEYVENDPEARDLAVFVNLIEKYGAAVILDVVSSLTAEDRAELVLSTVHKAKGREWATVKIAGDFREPGSRDDRDDEVSATDAMLGYVAVTRARFTLDRSGLAWVDKYARTR